VFHALVVRRLDLARWHLGFRRRVRLADSDQRSYRRLARLDQQVHHLVADCRPRIVEGLYQFRRRPGVEFHFQSPWILDTRRAFAAHSIDRSLELRLGDSRHRATMQIPGAGFDHQEAAIGIFDDVCWMEVGIIRN
jgi:hypothetical protein